MKSLILTVRPLLLTTSLMMALSFSGSVTNIVKAATESDQVTAVAQASASPTAAADTNATAAKVSERGEKPPRGVVVHPPKFDRTEPLPKEMENVGVAEHRGDQLPLDLRFTNEKGETVRLGDYFKAGKPVVLDLGYYSCPMLCDLVMNGLCDTMKEMKWVPGDDYQVIFVSIDPSENYKLAAAKKQTYIDDLNASLAAGKTASKSKAAKTVDQDSWHFLTGDQDNIAALAQAVGFAYQWDQRQMQYAHPAVLMIVTPDGTLSRYIYGVRFPAQTLKLSLVEASEGKIGSALDQLILTCFHYDPSIGSYTLSAYRLMRAGGYVTVLIVGGLIAFALLREKTRNRDSTDRGAPKSL